MEQLIVRNVEGSVAETVERLEQSLHRRGITIFATINHAAGARAAGIGMPDEVVVIFGDPAVGTGLMLDDPRSGLDLPLRMLIWDDGGKTRVGYRDPVTLADFDLSAHAGLPQKLSGLLAQLGSELESHR